MRTKLAAGDTNTPGTAAGAGAGAGSVGSAPGAGPHGAPGANKVGAFFERLLTKGSRILESMNVLSAREQEQQRDDVQERLLQGRRNFESLEEVHENLLKPSALRQARPFLTEVFDEYAQELDAWFSRLLMLVLDRRAARIATRLP